MAHLRRRHRCRSWRSAGAVRKEKVMNRMTGLITYLSDVMTRLQHKNMLQPGHFESPNYLAALEICDQFENPEDLKIVLAALFSMVA
jgi:hypothetical protein